MAMKNLAVEAAAIARFIALLSSLPNMVIGKTNFWLGCNSQKNKKSNKQINRFLSFYAMRVLSFHPKSMSHILHFVSKINPHETPKKPNLGILLLF